MKTAIIRLAYIILGFSIGFMAAMKFVSKISANTVFFILIFVIAGITIALIVEHHLETDSKKIFYFILFGIFAYPAAAMLQYIGAVLILIIKVIKVLSHIWF